MWGAHPSAPDPHPPWYVRTSLACGPPHHAWAPPTLHHTHNAAGAQGEAAALFTLLEAAGSTLGKDHPLTLSGRHSHTVSYLRTVSGGCSSCVGPAPLVLGMQGCARLPMRFVGCATACKCARALPHSCAALPSTAGKYNKAAELFEVCMDAGCTDRWKLQQCKTARNDPTERCVSSSCSCPKL